MGFLVQYAIASMMLSAIIVYIYDHTIGHLLDRITYATVRLGIFVGAWTLVTAILGSRGFGKGVSSLRQKTKDTANVISTLPKDVH